MSYAAKYVFHLLSPKLAQRALEVGSIEQVLRTPEERAEFEKWIDSRNALAAEPQPQEGEDINIETKD